MPPRVPRPQGIRTKPREHLSGTASGPREDFPYIHAVGYFVDAHLQRGEDHGARPVLDDALGRERHQASFVSAFRHAAMPARQAMKRFDWARVAVIEPRSPGYRPWDASPGAEGLSWLARGLGSVRTGDPETAREAEQRLAGPRDQARADGDGRIATYIEVDRRILAVRLARAQGNDDRAMELARTGGGRADLPDEHATALASRPAPFPATMGPGPADREAVMPRDPRHDVLFEPVRIGPVTAPNRFYQVPHCNGMSWQRPRAMVAMRAVKAEGRLWDDTDLPVHATPCEAVHAHGALAGIELCFNGMHAVNRETREIPLAPGNAATPGFDPVQARAMTRDDIRALRRWHREAARRAGYDIVYVYAGHGLALPLHFLSRRLNARTDEYGGSLENRARLLRELIEDTREAVGDRCAVAVCLAVDEGLGPAGIEWATEGREVVAMLAELPDLWDVHVADWANDSATARFAPEGHQEPFVAFVKQVTTKPVVGVGRFTSPDAMVDQIRRGVLDLIGAARPSIADPFLPRKIDEGRSDDIRECIGCNLCTTGDFTMVPIRCTQNPTMGEEWRRGWHPERVPAARLSGLATWARVRDHRTARIERGDRVEVYRGSRLEADDVLGLGIPRVVVATGARWRRDGVGRHHRFPVPIDPAARVLTPDDLLDGATPPPGPVVVFDDDHYYLGGVLAERLHAAGHAVTLVTPAPMVSQWTLYALEQARIARRLLELGVVPVPLHGLAALEPEDAVLACVYTGRFAMKGAGFLPCQLFVTERDNRSNTYYLVADWVEGYVSAYNRLAPDTVDVLSFESLELVLAVMDNHCQSNPDDPLHAVLSAMMETFIADRIRSESPRIEIVDGERRTQLYRETIRRIQARLAELGLYHGEIDGRYAESVRSALIAFHTDLGLETTGFPDQATLWRLLRG